MGITAIALVVLFADGKRTGARLRPDLGVCREENRVVARCAGVNRFAIPSCLIITKAAHGVALATR